MTWPGLPSQGTDPWYTPFVSAWAGVKTYIDNLVATKADIGHNHDGTYSTTAHLHTGTYEPAGAVASHVGAVDPHGDRAYTDTQIAGITPASIGAAPSVHTHDDRYYTETETDALLAGKSNTGHTHTLANITDAGTAAAADTSDFDAAGSAAAAQAAAIAAAAADATTKANAAQAAAEAASDPVGTGAAERAAHEAAGDPHPQYLTPAEGAAAYDALGSAAAAQAASQPLDSDLTAIAALSTTPFGRSLLELADDAALAAGHTHPGGSGETWSSGTTPPGSSVTTDYYIYKSEGGKDRILEPDPSPYAESVTRRLRNASGTQLYVSASHTFALGDVVIVTGVDEAGGVGFNGAWEIIGFFGTERIVLNSVTTPAESTFPSPGGTVTRAWRDVNTAVGVTFTDTTTAALSNGVGSDGDYYAKQESNIHMLTGPKVAGAWPATAQVVLPPFRQALKGASGTVYSPGSATKVGVALPPTFDVKALGTSATLEWDTVTNIVSSGGELKASSAAALAVAYHPVGLGSGDQYITMTHKYMRAQVDTRPSVASKYVGVGCLNNTGAYGLLAAVDSTGRLTILRLAGSPGTPTIIAQAAAGTVVAGDYITFSMMGDVVRVESWIGGPHGVVRRASLECLYGEGGADRLLAYGIGAWWQAGDTTGGISDVRGYA